MSHFLAAFALIFWTLAFIQTIANLRDVPRLKSDRAPKLQPRVSIVIPARNEARVIERTVRAFLDQDYQNFEVIVVNDRSTDATGEILRSISDPRLVVVEPEETPAGWLGKPWAMEQGSARARGELLLFVDADLIYAPAAIRAAVAEIESGGAALIALLPHFEMKTFAENVGMPMLAYFAFCGMPLWYSNRSRSPLLALGAGSGNLIRRETFESIGRFEQLKDAVIDDVVIDAANGLVQIKLQKQTRPFTVSLPAFYPVLEGSQQVSLELPRPMQSLDRGGQITAVLPGEGEDSPVAPGAVAISAFGMTGA